MYCDDYSYFFFFNDTATTEIYTLSLHDALPIFYQKRQTVQVSDVALLIRLQLLVRRLLRSLQLELLAVPRSEEHTSELQSRQYLVCRLLLEKKKKNSIQ